MKRIPAYILKYTRGTLYFLLMLVVAILVFSQTSLFRSIVKDKVTTILNETFRGNITIGSIEGTIVTSLIINDIRVADSANTEIFFIKRMEVYPKLLEFLSDRLNADKIVIDGLHANLVVDSNGVLNLVKILPKPSEKKEIDTVSKPFPFVIKAGTIELTNSSILYRKWDKLSSTEEYSSLNYDDLRLLNIDIKLDDLSVDIAKNGYDVKIKKFHLEPNLLNTPEISLSGELKLAGRSINVGDLKVVTRKSEITLNYKTDELNVFNNFTTDSLKKANFEMDLVCAPFHFDDISSLIAGFDFMKGAMEIDLAASGDLVNTKIAKLKLKTLKTDLSLTGTLLNLMDFDKLRMTASIKKSVLTPGDIHTLMPSLQLQKYLDFPSIQIDSLGFIGSPLTFSGGMGLRSTAGNISGSYKFDFSKAASYYEVDARTEKLDISKYVNLPFNLTSKIRARGYGFNPENAEFELDFDGDQSTIGKYFFDRFTVKTKGNNGKIGFQLSASLPGAQQGEIKGGLDMSDLKSPSYSISSTFRNIDLEYFAGNSMENSSINFTFDAEGKGFNPDDMVLNANLNLLDTKIKGDSLGEIDANIKLTATPDMQKDIFITSNLFTMSTAGRFSYATLGTNLGTESTNLFADLSKILSNYYPDFFEDSAAVANAKAPVPTNRGFSVKSNDSLSYSLQVKDLGPLKRFLKLRTFDIQGSLSGLIVLDTTKVLFSLNNDLDLLRLRASDSSSTLILWGSNSKIKLSHPSNEIQIGSIKGSIQSTTKKIFMIERGRADTLSNTELVVSLDKSILDLERLDINYNEMVKARVAMVVDFMKDSLELDMYETKIDYKGYKLENMANAVISFSNDALFVKNFSLGIGKREIVHLDARLDKDSLMADARIENISLHEIMNDIIKQPMTQPVDADIKFTMQARGPYDDPKINAEFRIDSIMYQKETLGKLIFSAEYKDEEIRPNGYFYSGETVGDDSLIAITGVIPYRISFGKTNFEFVKEKLTDIRIDARHFSLSALNGFIPSIKDLDGLFESQIKISGYYPDLVKSGVAEIKGGLFRVAMTNLIYGLEAGIVLNDSTLSVEKFVITNEGNLDFYGKITGTGSLHLTGYELKSGQIKLGGNLTVMDSKKPTKEFPIFGKLVVSTNEDIVLNINRNNYFVKASINLDKTDLTIPPTQSGVANAGDNYIYKYMNYDYTGGVLDSTFLSFLEDERQYKDSAIAGVKQTPFNLEYQIKITMSKNSKMTMILSQEANQKLTTYLEGELNYEKLGGFENVQGELRVSEESTLEFLNLKTFAALGTLRFEKEIFNPYLDIVANYNSYYIFSSKGTSNEQPVQVKLKLKGSMDELSTKFAKETDNIAVYVGEDNIKNAVPSPQYDKADAVWFILTGKFKSDLTEADKSSAEGQINTIQGTATSLAGSLLGGLLSSYLGDYVKSLEVRAAGNQTKFNLSGQISTIKYSFGGTTNVFQDLSAATFRFEIPVIKNFLIRIERRESIGEGSSNNTMINEMGLKYKIEF
ncbi:MAG: hypothetical protein J0L60_00380 [Ignavibacteria bacterium]|nr:hypothetical protein [Ignavibacteria bacterium]